LFYFQRYDYKGKKKVTRIIFLYICELSHFYQNTGMNLKYFFFLTFCFLFAFHISYFYGTPQVPQDNYRYHKVSKGETVYSIARTYDISTETIYNLNPQAKNGIKADEVLKLPLIKNAGTVAQSGSDYLLHSIQSGETLYSVSKQYNISVEDILAANEGINANNFRIGNAIRIPRKTSQTQSQSSGVSSGPVTATPVKQPSDGGFIKHKVKAQETLYKLASQYNISMQEIVEANPPLQTGGLKTDMIINIPVFGGSAVSSSNVVSSTTQNIFTEAQERMQIGLLLPFLDNDAKQKERLTEYYEGFLLSVEDIKAKGYSAELFVFDIRKGNSTMKLKSLLETYEIKNLDMIIGGFSDEEISILSKFTKENNIKYAIPFPVKNGNIIQNPGAYQVMISLSELSSKVVDAFYKRFSNYNIIFLQDSKASNNDKKEFVSLLESNLTRWGVSHRTFTIDDDFSTNLLTSLSSSKNNIIIPAGGSLALLNKIIPSLRNISTQNPEILISLFGYPEWQTYSMHYLQDFYKFDTYIYTSFFADNNDARVKNFSERFRKWYGKTMKNAFPKYGLLGYDTGIYFLTGLAQYKNSFDRDINKTKVNTLQSVFNFEKVDKYPGYVNTGMYFIHYKPDMSIEKIDCSK